MKKVDNLKKYKFIGKYLNTFVLILVIIILSILVYFLYGNFYLTLAEAKTVTDLQKKVISESLEKTKFYSTINNIEKKTATKLIQNELEYKITSSTEITELTTTTPPVEQLTTPTTTPPTSTEPFITPPKTTTSTEN